jgi:hypothetical protein
VKIIASIVQSTKKSLNIVLLEVFLNNYSFVKEGVSMAIFFLRPIENEIVNGDREFHKIDIEIHNKGDEDFDVLIQGYTNKSPFLMALHKVKHMPSSYSTIRLNNVFTEFGDIAFQFTTNIQSCRPTVIRLTAKHRNGTVIRTYTTSDCQVVE